MATLDYAKGVFEFDFCQPLVEDIWPDLRWGQLYVAKWPAFYSEDDQVGWKPIQLPVDRVRTVNFPQYGALVYQLYSFPTSPPSTGGPQLVSLAMGRTIPRPLVISKVDLLGLDQFIYTRSPYGKCRLNTHVVYDDDGTGVLHMEFC